MDYALDTLLSLHGTKYEYPCGYWIEIIAYRVEASVNRPHGIRYSLTLHDHHNQRVYGMDNAHAPHCPRRRMSRALVRRWDHEHKTMTDKGTRYDFVNAAQLMAHFYAEVEKILAEAAK